MQPNLEHFKVNGLQRDKTAAGFVFVCDRWGIITEVTVNGIISVLQAAKYRDVLSPSTTGLSFYFKGLCRRTRSQFRFRMIRIQAATTGHPRSMAADVPHFGGFIFTATAALRVFCHHNFFTGCFCQADTSV